MSLLPKIISGKRAEQRRAELYRSVIRKYAKKGGQLFGSIPEGHHRQFFCLDTHTWVWHEEWLDQTGKRQIVTTRYDVRPNFVLKSQGGNSYQRVGIEELRNLYQAARLYYFQIRSDFQF